MLTSYYSTSDKWNHVWTITAINNSNFTWNNCGVKCCSAEYSHIDLNIFCRCQKRFQHSTLTPSLPFQTGWAGSDGNAGRPLRAAKRQAFEGRQRDRERATEKKREIHTAWHLSLKHNQRAAQIRSSSTPNVIFFDGLWASGNDWI